MSLINYGSTAVNLAQTSTPPTPSGRQWIHTGPISTLHMVQAIYNVGNSATYMVGTDSTESDCFVTPNSGMSWSTIGKKPIPIPTLYGVTDENVGRVVVLINSLNFSNVCIYIDNTGSTWNVGGIVPNGTGLIWYGIAYIATSPSRLVAIGTRPTDNSIYSITSYDGGTTWQATGASTILPILGAQLSNICVNPNTNMLMCTLWGQGPSSYIFMSEDLGQTWSSLYFPATTNLRTRQITYDPVFNHYVLICYESLETYYSPDEGYTWVRAGNKPTDAAYSTCVYDPINHYLTAISEGTGINETMYSTTGGSSWHRDVPKPAAQGFGIGVYSPSAPGYHEGAIIAPIVTPEPGYSLAAKMVIDPS